jgi:hypothetical protein
VDISSTPVPFETFNILANVFGREFDTVTLYGTNDLLYARIFKPIMLICLKPELDLPVDFACNLAQVSSEFKYNYALIYWRIKYSILVTRIGKSTINQIETLNSRLNDAINIQYSRLQVHVLYELQRTD